MKDGMEQTELTRIVALESDLVTPQDFIRLIYEYDQYILKYPDVLTAYVNRANALQKLGLYQLALTDIEYVLTRKEDFALAWCHRAFILNTLGNYKEGWRDFEWRFQGYVKDSRVSNWPIPRWKGEALNGNTLFILSEQGLGDNIQFVRYAIEAKKRGMDIAVLNHKPLDNLLYFNLNKYGIPVMGYDSSIKNVAYYAHMMSFPYYFNTDLDTIPYSDKYIDAEPEYINKWEKLLGTKKKIRVGLVWSGSLDHSRNKSRNISFGAISTLFNLQDLEFHCLQKEIALSDREQAQSYDNLFLWNDKLNDFSDTAGLISQLDLVISVDTSVAHLAGAMAIPTWIMITHHPDYRWLLAREDSPWYRSVKLFRQDISMNWVPVIDNIYLELKRRFVE